MMMSTNTLQSETKYSEKDILWLKSKLGEVKWDVKQDLIKALETDTKQWRDLVAALPQWLTRSRIRIHQLESVYSPPWALMQKLEQWNFTVADLITCLERVKLYNALLVIKPDVELEIVKDLEDSLYVKAGSAVQLTCQATGFPSPQYQWYKDDQEILCEVSATLTYEVTSLNDSGVYHCKVYTIDRLTKMERPNPLFSNYCTVSILEPLPSSPVPPTPQGCSPVISLQPVSPGLSLPHGSSCILRCTAEGDPPLTYQWFKDGLHLPGATENELCLNRIFPDQIGRKHSWEYQCLVQNCLGQTFTDRVTVGISKKEIHFTATDKIALLIGNENYTHMDSFILPSSDVSTLSIILRRQGFRVMSYVDLTLKEMYSAVHHFCSQLRQGAYGFFYFAGHGFERQKRSFMQPVDVSDDIIFEENLSLDYVASLMQQYDPAISIFFMDMCRECPPLNILRQTPGFCQERKYQKYICFYATSYLGEAFEVNQQQNSLFVQHLKCHMEKKKCIYDIIWDVQQDMSHNIWVQRQGQNPSIDSNISEARSFWDPVQHSSQHKAACDMQWEHIYRCPEKETFDLGIFRLVITFSSHKDVFCNALDMNIHVIPLHNLAQGQCIISLIFQSKDVTVERAEGSDPACAKYILKGLQKLKQPVLYRVTLKTSKEHLSQTCSLSLPGLSSLNLACSDLPA